MRNGVVSDRKNMAELGFELEEIARLIKLVEHRGLAELVVEEEGRRVVIRGASYRSRSASTVIAGSAATSAHSADQGVSYAEEGAAEASAGVPLVHSAPSAGSPAVDHRVAVSSPTVGVFYRAAGPDTAPYVEVGDHLEIGQTVGMLEAMKVFSEIPSDHAGRVVEIVAENGQLVRPGEPLLYLAE
jgi:acetyl-CoA carboxylase biotin carboxyl carrier protein